MTFSDDEHVKRKQKVYFSVEGSNTVVEISHGCETSRMFWDTEFTLLAFGDGTDPYVVVSIPKSGTILDFDFPEWSGF